MDGETDGLFLPAIVHGPGAEVEREISIGESMKYCRLGALNVVPLAPGLSWVATIQSAGQILETNFHWSCIEADRPHETSQGC
jgi:hypothetical protein